MSARRLHRYEIVDRRSQAVIGRACTRNSAERACDRDAFVRPAKETLQ